MLCFHCNSIEKCLTISFNFSFDPWVILNVLLGFQIFGGFFSNIFMLLLSSLITFWSENIFCLVWIILKSLRFVPWKMVYLGKYSVCIWKEYAFCYNVVKNSININLATLADSAIQVLFYPYWFSVYSNTWEMGIEMSEYNYAFAYFFL